MAKFKKVKEAYSIDTLLVNGDHFTDGRGIPVTLSGERELIQRALLRLTIKKGSFKEDEKLGSELHKLCGSKSRDLAKLAESYAQEALLPMPEIFVSSVTLEQKDMDILRLNVELATAQNQYKLEVDIA